MVVDGRRLVTALRNEFGDCLYLSQVVHPAGFLNMKRLGASLIPPGWDAGPLKTGKPPPFPSILSDLPNNSPATHLYSWVKRGTMRLNCVFCPRTQHTDPAGS